MHDAVLILDENYNVLDNNHVANIWYDYTDAEFKHLNLSDIRAPDEREKIKKQMHTVNEKEGDVWETIHQRKDGTTFNVEVSSTPIEVGKQKRFYHVVRDITLRKKHEAELEASRARYKQIVEFSPDAIFVHRDGKVIFMNNAGLKLFGANSQNDMIGKNLWSLYPPERHGIVRARNQHMEQTHEAVPTIEHTMLRLDGGKIYVEATACYIEYDGEPAFYVTLRDINEKRKQHSLLNVQQAVSKALIETTNLSDVSKYILQIICTNLNLDAGRVLVVDKKENVLRQVASWIADSAIELMNNDLSIQQNVVHENEGVAGTVFVTQNPAWIENATPKYEIKIALPILNEHELLGVIEFTHHTQLSHDETIMQALSVIGDQFGMFLKRKKFEKDLTYLTKHDPITGLSSRSFFEETLSFELNLTQVNDRKLAVLFIDIDSFNIINETMGHALGDELLKMVANRMLSLNLPRQNLARFGPQFAILMQIDKIEDLVELIRLINTNVATEVALHEQKVNIYFNFGIAVYPEDGASNIDLMRSASVALSSAREVGGGAVQFCTVDLNLRAQRRVKLENDLRQAINRNELFLTYQPIIDTMTMTVAGFESLVRWQHEGKLISPADFIPLAEKTHQIVEIGAWIMRMACLQYKEWKTIMQSPLFISVNISPLQFKYGGVLDMLSEVIVTTEMDPKYLKIEITETALMDDARKNIDILHEIKNMGIKVSIDDFGVGYSSLNYLRHLPIDYIKIDQSFVRNMPTDAHDAAIVKTIIDLAQNLNYTVIAEGVETQEQLNFLTTLGCHNIQGYYFSQPLKAVDATNFIIAGKLLR